MLIRWDMASLGGNAPLGSSGIKALTQTLTSVKKKVTNSQKKWLLVNKSQPKVNVFDFFLTFC
jgi:hypothetical protein